MVLLKLGGDRAALLGQQFMIWPADDTRSLKDSLTELLRMLRHPKAATFINEYRLSANGKPLDLAETPASCGLTSGQEVLVGLATDTGGTAGDGIAVNASMLMGGGGGGASASPERAGANVMTPGPWTETVGQPHPSGGGMAAAPPLTQHLAEFSKQQTIMEEVSHQVHNKFKEELLRMEHTRQRRDQERMNREKVVEGRNVQMLEDFLRQYGLLSMLPKLRSLGVTSLATLCGRTSSEIASIGIDQRSAFELITEAHNEMQRHKVPIDWKQRITDLYQRYNPSRVQQVPALMDEYSGEEEDMWMALRAKYEEHLFHDVMNDRPKLEDKKREVSSQRPPAALKDVVDHAARVASQLRQAPSNADVYSCPVCGNLFQVPASLALKEALDSQLAERKQFEAKIEAATQREGELKDVIAKLSQQVKNSEEDRARHEHLAREQEEWIKMLEYKLRQTQEQLTHVGKDFDFALAKAREESQSTHEDIRRKLCDFYLRYYPDRLQYVDSIVAAYAGRERDLLQILDTSRGSIASPTRTRDTLEAMASGGAHHTHNHNYVAPTPTVAQLSLSPVPPAGLNNTNNIMQTPNPVAMTPQYDRIRRRLVDFYLKYAPDKLHLVDTVMAQCQGREQELERLIDMQPIPVAIQAQTHHTPGYGSGLLGSAPPVPHPRSPSPGPPPPIPNVRWAH